MPVVIPPRVGAAPPPPRRGKMPVAVVVNPAPESELPAGGALAGARERAIARARAGRLRIGNKVY